MLPPVAWMAVQKTYFPYMRYRASSQTPYRHACERRHLLSLDALRNDCMYFSYLRLVLTLGCAAQRSDVFFLFAVVVNPEMPSYAANERRKKERKNEARIDDIQYGILFSISRLELPTERPRHRVCAFLLHDRCYPLRPKNALRPTVQLLPKLECSREEGRSPTHFNHSHSEANGRIW